MKARKFWKRVLTIKYLLALLIVLCLSVVVVLYFAIGLDENRITLDNIDFTTEGFENFNGKDESELNRAKVVSENDKYIMFMDEATTIVTVAVKSSLKSGASKTNPNSYTIKYTTAKSDGVAAKLPNFTLSYSTHDLTAPVNKTVDSYTNSVNTQNVLTGESDRHYQIKYLEDQNAAQVYYTIGQFGDVKTYFSQNIYATVYEPARCLYDSDEEWQEAVDKYEAEYLATVGDISNTFEEKLRGNVQTITKLNDGTMETEEGSQKVKVIALQQIINVYSQEALDYLYKTVFPEMAADGIEVPSHDEDTLNGLYEKARKNAEKNGKEKVEWQIQGVPIELVDYNNEYYKKYFNNENSPLTNNPFLLTNHFTNFGTSFYRLIKADGSTVDHAYYQLSVNPGPAAGTLYNHLYTNEPSVVSGITIVQEVDGEYAPYASSGFPLRDEEGNFVYDEEGRVVKGFYTQEMVEFENTLFGVETEGLAVFKIALEFKLTNEGLVVTVPAGSLVDSSNVTEDDPDYALINGRYIIRDIKLCHNMTNVDNTQDGYMIIPDGSGAIINFNNGKTETISATYYGNDNAYVTAVTPEETASLLLGMFAFVNTTEANPGGLLAVIEKGAGQVSLTAGVSQQFKENYANLSINLRNKETVRTGTVSDSSSYDKFDKILSPSDIVINYLIIDETELDYTSIAKKYQQYLMNRDGLEYNDSSDTLLTDLTMLGTYEKYDLFLGIKYMKGDTLTTFEQAEEIIDELLQNNVDRLSVSYKGWTNDYLEYELGSALKVAKELGKTATMRSFYNYCVEKGVSFYPELSITTAKGYDYLLGSTRFTARGVGNEEAIHYQYDLATGRPNKTLSKTYAISPLYYKNITQKLLNDFSKLNVWNEKSNGGFYLTDLGNQWTGNYHENDQVYASEAVLYQQEVLEMIAQGNKIKIEAPCDYAFKYVDVATSVPVSSAMYTVYDQTIPFYQLVISGLFDYTTEHINGLSDRSPQWFLAKILETGSNTSFIISAEDPSVLLETDYTQYYKAYYNNWKEYIISFANEINALGIHSCYLAKHEVIDGLSRVTYVNKNTAEEIVLVINVSEVTKTYNNVQIPGYGYIKEK